MDTALGPRTQSAGMPALGREGAAPARRILSDGFIAALVDVTRRASIRSHRKTDSADSRRGNI